MLYCSCVQHVVNQRAEIHVAAKFGNACGLSVQAGKPKPAEAAKAAPIADGQARNGGQPTADDGYREIVKHAIGAAKAGPHHAAL